MKYLIILLSVMLSAFGTAAPSQNLIRLTPAPVQSYSSKFANIGANNSQGIYEMFQFMRMMSPGSGWDNSCKVIRKGKSYVKVQIAQRVQYITYQFKFRNEKYDWEDDKMIVFTKDDIKDFGKNLCLFLKSEPGQYFASQQYVLRNDTGIGIDVYIEDGYCLLSYKEVKKLIKVIDNL